MTDGRSAPRWGRALLVVLALVSGCGGDPERGCAELSERVQGLDVVEHANGISRSAPAWLAVLTTDPDTLADEHRREIAEAVAADGAGYAALRAAVAADQLDGLDLLHAVASDASAEHDAEWDAARVELARYGTSECGLA